MIPTCVTGQCFDVHTGHPIPGLEYVLGTESNPQQYDTIVMANLVNTIEKKLYHPILHILFSPIGIFSTESQSRCMEFAHKGREIIRSVLHISVRSL